MDNKKNLNPKRVGEEGAPGVNGESGDQALSTARLFARACTARRRAWKRQPLSTGENATGIATRNGSVRALPNAGAALGRYNPIRNTATMPVRYNTARPFRIAIGFLPNTAEPVASSKRFLFSSIINA